MSKKVLCCVAWPYANGPRHIGHVAGFGIPSDIFARYQRMAGNDVLMVSGTDEHGTPIQVQADQEGITPIELTDRYNSVIVDDLVDLGLTYDIFTRTTTSIHEETVQKMFTRLLDNGYIYLDSVLGAFSPSTGRALPDRYIEGVCPKCGYEQARGDQCDNCGIQLDPADLKNPRSKINGETPEFKESEHYFLDLPAFKDELRTYIDTVGTANKWRDNVKKFSLNLIDDLHSRAISRDIEWGITIPTDKYRDDKTKKLYVWFDAVIGYLSSSIEWATRFGDNPDSWRDYWNDRETMTYYFMGKDNITFHTQIWPAELMGVNAKSESASEFGQLNLPDNIVSSEFLTMNDEQFSSSRGHVIYVREMLDNYSADALRYYISVAGPEVQDSNFTWEDFVTRNNNELVAGWGNLINRVANLIFKNFGSVPDLKELTDAQANITTTAGGDSNVVNIDELGIALKAEIDAAFDVIGELIQGASFKAAISEIFRLVGLANKYVASSEPWKQKEDLDVMGNILNYSLYAIVNINTLLIPFIPSGCKKVAEYFELDSVKVVMPERALVSDERTSKEYSIITGDYTGSLGIWKPIDLQAGQKLEKPEIFFAKYELPTE